MHEILQDANRAGLTHVQRWAGVTRTGHHGARVEGQQPGKYESAELAASSWLQGLSRAGSPQLHAHNQWTRMAFTTRDGKGRAMDTMALRAQLPAVAGIVAARAEAALAREFGVEWVARPDGKGNEIKGVTRAEMTLFSERTRDINKAAQELAQIWEERNGRPPTEYELLHITQRATMRTRAGKEDGSINWDGLAEDWDRRMLVSLGERLADIAPRISNLGPDASRSAEPEPAGPPPTCEKQQQAVHDAVEILGNQKSAWRRAEFVRVLQAVMPTECTRMDPDDAVRLLDSLSDEAVSGRVAEAGGTERRKS